MWWFKKKKEEKKEDQENLLNKKWQVSIEEAIQKYGSARNVILEIDKDTANGFQPKALNMIGVIWFFALELAKER